MNVHASPLRYPGGKARIFKFFSRVIRDNDLIGIEYVEPYCGGAGLALKLLYGGYVSRIAINDIDPAIAAFWRTALTDSERLCSWISSVEVSVKTWQACKEIYRNKHTADEFDLGTAAFFLNRTNVSGVLKSGGIIGGRSQSGKYGIDARFNKSELVHRIEEIGRFSHSISFYQEDALDLLRRLRRRKPNHLVYMDPPYYRKGADLYLNFYKDQDHIRLARLVNGLKCPWLVSYDLCDFVVDLYTKHQCVTYKLRQNTSSRLGDEAIFAPTGLLVERASNELFASSFLKRCA